MRCNTTSFCEKLQAGKIFKYLHACTVCSPSTVSDGVRFKSTCDVMITLHSDNLFSWMSHCNHHA